MNTPAIRGPARQVLARLRHGRPLLLAARFLGGSALAGITLHTGAGPAPEAGVLAGIITWLALTARRDIAPPRQARESPGYGDGFSPGWA